ncbi:imidazolonepropionase-like amidohydrolase [Microbacterium sp. AG1240]|uniref:metal-dependent hydrolase family protein n=1 Tax=Microbacterium sp. AG1240 TaxID=2183992 RepID=UPI000EACEB05|nr:amidohydrolase family protein [Microbacterium sp. AG1240]RKT35836.1 imidazolonepropionase-like amidohydrolase [Microbacterium sp. AG1240]
MTARLPLTPVNAAPYRLVGATLIDGTLSDPLPDAEVEVVEGRIAYVGPRRPSGRGRAIDLGGRFLLPGFVDAHVHLVMSTAASRSEQADWFDEEWVVAALANLRATVEAGVTTARDLSGLTPGYRSAVASGAVAGPRLHLAISMLSPTGGHADPVRANGSVPVWAARGAASGVAVVDTPDEVVKVVRELVRTGADVIKVCTSGGVTSPHDSPEDRGLPREHVELVVAEMRGRHGQPVAAHAQNDEGVRAAVLGGAASIEHGYDMSDETIALMLERGTTLVPTLSTLLRPSSSGDDPARRRRQERAITAISAAVARGVAVAMGTDAGIHPQGRNLTELGHLVGVGLTPLRAVHAGTLAGARLLRLDEHLGSVEAGKLADLVVTAVDPLADLDALGDPTAVRAVVQGGRFVKDLDGLAR